jgi:hypothetical protein
MKPCNIKYKPKHPKERGIQGTKMEAPHPRRPKKHLRGRITRGNIKDLEPSPEL